MDKEAPKTVKDAWHESEKRPKTLSEILDAGQQQLATTRKRDPVLDDPKLFFKR